MKPSWKPLKYSRIAAASSGVFRIRVVFIQGGLEIILSTRASEEPGDDALRLLVGEDGVRTETLDLGIRAVASSGKAIAGLRAAQVHNSKRVVELARRPRGW